MNVKQGQTKGMCNMRLVRRGCLLVSAAAMSLAASAAETKCPVSEKVCGRENVEWSVGYSYHLTDGNKDLPRVLLIGDSICNGYQSGVRKRLEGKMNVSYWASSLCVSSPRYIRMLDYYLDEAKYDIIHFNNGLHSLKTQDDAYEAGLKAALAHIGRKQPEARIVWCSSTPLKSGEKTGKVRALNAIGAREAARLGLAVNDLFSLLDPLDRESNWLDMYHHRPNVCEKSAAQVAATVISENNKNRR